MDEVSDIKMTDDAYGAPVDFLIMGCRVSSGRHSHSYVPYFLLPVGVNSTVEHALIAGK